MRQLTNIFIGDIDASKHPLSWLIRLIFSEIFTLCKLNILFLMCCIPVITIGPSWTALTQVSRQLLCGNCSNPAAEFFHALKENFKSGLIAAVLCGGACVAALISCFIYWELLSNYPLFHILFFVASAMLIVLLLLSTYVFPLIVSVDLSFRAIFWDALLLTLTCFHHSIPSIACVLALSVITLYAFPFTIPFGMILLFSLSNLIISYAAWTDIKNFVICNNSEPSLEKSRFEI